MTHVRARGGSRLAEAARHRACSPTRPVGRTPDRAAAHPPAPPRSGSPAAGAARGPLAGPRRTPADAAAGESTASPGGPLGSPLGSVLVLVLAAAAVAVGPRLLGGSGEAGAAASVVGASLPVWGLEAGSRTVAAHAAVLTSASPSLYEVTSDGGVQLRPQPDGPSPAQALDRLRRAGVALVPTVTNTRDGDWDPALVQRVLHDPVLRDRHVAALLELAQAQDLAGLDVDYEELAADDRDAFSDFLGRLGVGLRAQGRFLAVDVFAKDSDAGYDERNLAQDYAAIGRAADEVRLMAYDWHWQTSGPGPIAPVDWVRRVVDYALTRVPAHEVVLGVPTYGYDWVGQQGRVVSWSQARALAAEHGVPVRWDDDAASPSLQYDDDRGDQHVLWFEDGASTAAKLEVARDAGIGGVYLWLVGDEDPRTWQLLRAHHRGSAPAGGAR